MLGSMPGTVPTRREEYAEATHGGVCCATIYAVSGGKQGLLNTLMDIWTRAPIVSTTLDRVDLDDPAAILRTVAATCRNMRAESGDIMRVLLATATKSI